MPSFSTRTRQVSIFLLFSLSLLLTSVNASAQQEKSFEELVAMATNAYKAGDYDKAVTYLQQANFKQHTVQLLFNIARSYEKKGDCKMAFVYYKAYLRSPDSEDNIKGIVEKEIKKGCDDYKPDQVSGRTEFFSTPAGALVTLDGKEIGVTPVEVAGLAPGEHTLKLTLEGREAVEKKITVASETDLKVEENLPEQKIVKKDPEDTKDPDDKKDPDANKIEIPKEDPPPKINIPAIAIAGTGLVVLGIGAYLDLGALPAIDEERKQFEPGSTEFNDLTDKRNSRARGAIISYVAGAVLLAGGLTWLALDMFVLNAEPKENPAAKTSFNLIPVLGPETVGLGLGGRF